MTIETGLRCLQCGAVWQSAPAAQVAAARGGCLRCGGELVDDSQPDDQDRDQDQPERDG